MAVVGAIFDFDSLFLLFLGGGGLAPPRSDDTGAMGGYDTGRIMS